VFTLHAELEGMKFLPVFEALLEGWQAQGWRLVSMAELAEALAGQDHPKHQFLQGNVAGRSGTLSVQGPTHPPAALAAEGPAALAAQAQG
jgi:hypothetical protein